MSAIVRQTSQLTVSIPEAQHLSNPFKVGGHSSGSFQLPDAITSGTVGLQVSNDGEAFSALTDKVGAALTVCTVVAAGSYPFPPELFSFQWARLVSNLDEAAGRACVVFLQG